MRLLLAGMTLATLGQVAHANPYADGTATPPPAAAATDTASTEVATSEPGRPDPGAPTHSQTDLANLFNNQPAPTAAAPTEPEPAAAPLSQSNSSASLAGSSLPATPLTQPADPSQRSLLVSGPKPSKLMEELMNAPAGAPLAGTPITLGDAVRDSRSRQDQTQRARAYWDLAAAVADYYLAVLEAQELDAYRAGVTAPSKQWDVRLADSKTRIDATRLAAQSAQLQLHNLLGGAATSLPLPADVPHCGRYNAEYDEIFGSRPDPVAKKLAEVLALRHAELRSMTQAIDEAKALVEQEVSMRAPTNDGTQLLNAQQLLSLERRQFVARAREYNQEIAAYTELAAPADVASDRLVAMMIRTATTTDQLPWRDGDVEPTSAQAPADEANFAAGSTAAASGVKPTFQAERHQEVRRPLQRLIGRERERSIVVKRLRNLMDRE
jgi:hypothetical protein